MQRGDTSLRMVIEGKMEGKRTKGRPDRYWQMDTEGSKKRPKSGERSGIIGYLNPPKR